MTMGDARSQEQGVESATAANVLANDTGPSASEALAPDPFRATFERELDYVWTTLRRLGVREADLEDVAHEVFLRVHRRFAEYDASRPIRPWLFGFAARVAADYRKLARHRREVRSENDDAVDPAPLADERLAALDARALVARGLEALDLDKRTVFIAHDLDGLTAQQISEALELPLFTVYSRLRVARERFTASVKRLDRAGAGEHKSDAKRGRP
jgi:RNA polymerase sigma-70 factor, ECF subfamily